jgi:hypothetical protein
MKQTSLTTQVAVFSVTLASSAVVRATLPATKNLQESKQKMRLRSLCRSRIFS